MLEISTKELLHSFSSRRTVIKIMAEKMSTLCKKGGKIYVKRLEDFYQAYNQ